MTDPVTAPQSITEQANRLLDDMIGALARALGLTPMQAGMLDAFVRALTDRSRPVLVFATLTADGADDGVAVNAIVGHHRDYLRAAAGIAGRAMFDRSICRACAADVLAIMEAVFPDEQLTPESEDEPEPAPSSAGSTGIH